MSTYRLDVPELHRRLDARRTELGLTWRGISRQTGISISTFTRISKGRSIEADALITLLVWLDFDNEIATIIEPGQPKLPCPDCRRLFEPKNDGTVRPHICEEAVTEADVDQMMAQGTPVRVVTAPCRNCRGSGLDPRHNGEYACPDCSVGAAERPECAASISGRCLNEAESDIACDTDNGECVHGGRPATDTKEN